MSENEKLTNPDGSIRRGAFYGRVRDLTRQEAKRRGDLPFVVRERRGGSEADRYTNGGRQVNDQ
ncbi:MAG: hypothetical protein A2135_09980 [Actinobacteria bacterium RBG_16_67_15]|nr:MAG: hypothetical protein A2135_09980 [Actinobacteria bacterium RBG_16_67_15]